jgi:hypothetical protein
MIIRVPGGTVLRLLDSRGQIHRNRRKFFMKYGFDIIQYTDLAMTGNTDEEMLDQMGISSNQLEHFRKDLRTKKLKQLY